MVPLAVAVPCTGNVTTATEVAVPVTDSVTGVAGAPYASVALASATDRAGIGVTAFDGADAALLPALLCAVTVNVYAVPLARPPTVIGLPAPVAVMPPGLAVTV